MIPLNDKVLTAGEVAALFGVSIKTVMVWRRKGSLPADFYTLGHHARYYESRIRGLLNGEGVTADQGSL